MLRPDRALMRGDFLFWCLKARPIIDEFSIRAKGITRFGLTLDGIGSVPVPSPDLDTQESIATFLDRETARIDQLIEKKQRFIALTEEHWRSTLDHLICGRGSDSLSTPVTHAAISSIPSSWELTPLKYLTDINRPIMYGIVLPGPNVDHGVMIVKGGDVKPERLHPDRLCKTTFEIERGYERSRLKCGDLLIPRAEG